MLSFVLPLLAIAIGLTPVVASAGAFYKRETDEYSRSFSDLASSTVGRIELHN